MYETMYRLVTQSMTRYHTVIFTVIFTVIWYSRYRTWHTYSYHSQRYIPGRYQESSRDEERDWATSKSCAAKFIVLLLELIIAVHTVRSETGLGTSSAWVAWWTRDMTILVTSRHLNFAKSNLAKVCRRQRAGLASTAEIYINPSSPTPLFSPHSLCLLA